MKRAIFVFVLLGLMGLCVEAVAAEEEPNPLEILAAKVLELDGSEWEAMIRSEKMTVTTMRNTRRPRVALGSRKALPSSLSVPG